MSRKNHFTADNIGDTPTIRQQWHAFYRLWRITHGSGNMWHSMCDLDWSLFFNQMPWIDSWRLLAEWGDSRPLCLYDRDLCDLVRHRLFSRRPKDDSDWLRYEDAKRQARNFFKRKKEYKKAVERKRKRELLEWLEERCKSIS